MAYQLSSFIEVGREIFRQNDYARMFRLVIDEVIDALGAEGGTLYLHDSDANTLNAVVVVNQVLKLEHAISEFNPSNIQGLFKIQLNKASSTEEKSISGSCFRTKQTIFIKDVSIERQHDLAALFKFDRENNYQTKSLIAFPLLSRDNDVLGVVQLVNPDQTRTAPPEIDMILLLASFMGIALENRLLLLSSQNLLSATIEMISSAIDEKSKSTSGHCHRVTELTMMLARAMAADTNGKYRDFNPTPAEMNELRVAALLHDVGKIATPNFVLEKKRKLEAIIDNIETIRLRMQLRRSLLRIKQLEETMQARQLELPLEEAYADDADMQFLANLNEGGEFITDETMQRLEQIATLKCGSQKVLTEDDLINLSTRRGTLNATERKIMEEHASISIRLLNKLPWPRDLANVKEIAGKHHENCDGSGYPLQLTAEQMSLRARILSLTDRFEGLSAQDRTYRAPKTMQQVMQIMEHFSAAGHIDAELFEFFVEKGVHQEYYDKFMKGNAS